MSEMNRRQFLGKTAAAGVGLSTFGILKAVRGADAPSNAVRIAVMGVNSRGTALSSALARLPGVQVVTICDVDSRAIAQGIAAVTKNGGAEPKGEKDFRRVLEDPTIDGMVMATPDHWHAPGTIMALAAGKNVYCEKPLSHNCREGEMVIEAVRKSGKVFQMGNQRRSQPGIIEGIKLIHEGGIGRPYFGRGWYCNNRASIGIGKEAPVPEWLDYELWQGPAPRRPYKDNLIHYNWHWFWNWGTGETCNNGTHEIDVMRWAMQADFPTKVTSTGGRYRYDDDWEFYDTQVVGYEFPNEQAIVWEGRSVNAIESEGRPRGAHVFGETGSVIFDTAGYTHYDEKGKEVKSVQGETDNSGIDTRSPGIKMDMNHLGNFCDAIRGNAKPNSVVEEGHKSVVLCHLGNVAQKSGRVLNCSPENGHIIGDDEAMKMWGREYEPGWEPKV